MIILLYRTLFLEIDDGVPPSPKNVLGRYFWVRGYFVASSGTVTDEVIKEYIRTQYGIEPDGGGENFHVEKS